MGRNAFSRRFSATSLSVGAGHLLVTLLGRSMHANVEYLAGITCGSAAIRQVSLGLTLPASIDLATVQIGADAVGQTDCLDLDPTNCIGASGVFAPVDASLSRVVPPNVAGVPDTYYFTVVGSGPGQRLCNPGQSVEVLKIVAPENVPDSERPGLITAGLPEVSAAVPGVSSTAFIDVSGQPLAVDDYAWLISAEDASVRILIAPALGDAGDLWDLVLDAAMEVKDLTFGVVLPPGTPLAEVVGCPSNAQLPATQACSPSPTGSLTSQADPSLSWTVGPHPSLPAANVLYFRAYGALWSGSIFGQKTLNVPYTAVNLATVRLVGATAADPIALTIAGAESVSPEGAAVVRPNGLVVVPTDQNIALTEAGGLLQDLDGDGIVDESDHCIYAYDPTNADHGGLLGSGPDGVGDACQCGDAHPVGEPGRGIVDASDVPLFLAAPVGDDTPPLPDPRCNNGRGEGVCDILFSVVLSLLVDGPATPAGPGLHAVCSRTPAAV